MKPQHIEWLPESWRWRLSRSSAHMLCCAPRGSVAVALSVGSIGVENWNFPTIHSNRCGETEKRNRGPGKELSESEKICCCVVYPSKRAFVFERIYAFTSRVLFCTNTTELRCHPVNRSMTNVCFALCQICRECLETLVVIACMFVYS